MTGPVPDLLSTNTSIISHIFSAPRLAHFSELDHMEIWAADGHHIAHATHATHDPRNEKGAYSPVNAIYKLDLRSGWMRFMDLARPTARGTEHEITTLKRQDKFPEQEYSDYFCLL